MTVQRDIEDLYPLSPVQQGLLFHALRSPAERTHFRQAEYELRGEVQAAALRGAWQAAVDRHAVLRTAFNWRSRAEPFQVVYRSVQLAWDERDWRGLTDAEWQERRACWLEEDARAGFDLSRPPLLRLALIRRADRVWRLIATSHLLVLDGWSQPLLLAEVAARYRSLVEAVERPLPAVRPFADYVAWIRNQDAERTAAFWRRAFAGYSPPPAPEDRRAAAAPSGSWVERQAELPEPASGRLRAFARRHQVTLNTLIQGAFALLLSRLEGCRDVVFGVTVSGRPAELAGVESMIGLFINTLPLRLEVPPAGELVSWLKGIQALHSELRQFEHTALSDLHGWSGVPRERPLFDSVLVFENFPMALAPGAAGSELELELVRSTVHTNYPLVLTVWPEPALRLRLTAGAARSEAPPLERMLHRLLVALSALAEGVDRRLGSVPVATAAEVHQLLWEWNPAGSAGGGETCVHQLVEEQARRQPAATAMELAGEELSYGELNRRANRLAHRLRRLGVAPEVAVGVHMERSLELVVGLLGILKAGGAYVPLDPGHPAERLSLVAADAGVSVLLVDRLAGNEWWAAGRAVICLDQAGEELAGESAANPGGGACADSLAYVMYTSGSTGRPKGVAIPHRAIVWHLATLGFVELTAPDRVAQASTASFDAATFEIWGALASGARLVGLPSQVVVSPRELASRLARERISVLYLTAALFSQTARQVPVAFAGLRCVLSSGEAADVAAYRAVLGSAPPLRLLHLYGPTETTVFSSWNRIAEVADGCTNLSIGRPIERTRAYLLDGELRLVPAGVPGELCIGGDGLARGYMNRPELTAASFVPNPFAEEPGSRLYRTGDRVRHLPDGRLEFLGRLDEQVKLRGIRIEPGEVQAVLARHPAVRDSLVLVREDEPGKRILVAYVVMRAEGAPTGEELRAFLRASLLEAMVPSAFVRLPALPLSPNGKVDRRSLPPPPQAAPEGLAGGPRSPLERDLAAIWAELLEVERVGIRDDFFALGGHSLLAMQLVSRVRQVFGVELPLRELLESPRVEAMALAIEGLGRLGAPLEVPPLTSVPRPESLPLSFAQQRLWLIDQLSPGSDLYNIAAVLAVEGALDRRALAAALATVVQRHEALRTVFPSREGRPLQIVREPATGGESLPLIDLIALTGNRRQEEALRVAAAETGRGFDLARGPLLRCRLLALASEEHLVVLALHHVVGDGWSMGLLIGELTSLYAGFRQARPSPLPALPLQYADYTLWQRAWLQGSFLARQLAYWRRRLAGAPASLELPADRPRQARAGHRGARRHFLLPAAPLAALEEFAGREHATPFMLLLAAWQALLGRYCGQRDVLVGTPIAGRHHHGLERLIGLFVNTLVLRAELSGASDFRALLAQVRETALGAYAHQDLPFEKLVEDLGVGRALDRHPLFQVLLAYQDDAAGDEDQREVAGLRLRPVAGASRVAKFDLSLTLRRAAGRLTGYLEYDRDLFDAATIERLLGHFRALLAAVIAAPGSVLSELCLLTAAERHELLWEWNATAADYPCESSLPQLFEAQVESVPAAVAVTCGGDQLSYLELNRRANRLAHGLIARGVLPESRVGLCMERSAEAVIAVLAILKAGAAYVPLDPAYPRPRLELMVEKSAMTHVLVDPWSLDALPRTAAEVVVLAPGWLADESRPAGNPRGRASAASLAYVLFTSGSTGGPKGVAVPHRAVVRLVRGTDFVAIRPGDAVLQVAPLGFDASTFEIWAPLLNGARLVILPTARPTLEELGRAFERHGVTVAHLTTGLFHAIVESQPGSLATLRHVLAGGDVLSAQLVRNLLETGRPGLASNCYGPTENTTFTCCHAMSAVPEAGRPLPIGRPIANTTAHVLDRELRLVPPGVAGELYAGGDGLARGYLGQPDWTAERFLPDPFSAAGGARLYATGDQVRWRGDGRLEFLGRFDEQVKVRGFRVELAEIEAALAEHPAVRDLAVLAPPDRMGGRRLVAYVVARGPGAPAARELRAFLGERLPAHMVPSAFVQIGSLPLTPHGKIDRAALAGLVTAAPSAGEPAVAGAPGPALDPFVEVVAGIFAEVLGLPQVEPEADFFELGGHSLLATQVISRLRLACGRELPLAELFAAPTAAGLARRVEAAWRPDARAAPPLARTSRVGPLPLSFSQQRLWLIDRLAPASSAYNLGMALRCTGELVPARLAASLDEVARRHEALRTRFVEVDGEPRQAIMGPSPVGLPVVDLRRLPMALREAEALAAAEARRPFDLARGPLVRARMLLLGSREAVLLFTLHHIVADAWSLGVLVREVAALYHALTAGRAAALPELPIQYADFAQWQRELLQGEAVAEHLAYWRQRLGALPPPLELPADRPRPPMSRQRGARLPCALGESLSRDLRRLGRDAGATLFMTLLAGFQALLSRYTGQEDLVVGAPIAGRNRVEIEALIGCFVNTLVLRARPAGGLSFRELLEQVRDECLGAHAHQDLPFEKLVEELAPARSLSRSPLFQVLFALQNAPRHELELPGVVITPLSIDTRTARFDVELSLADHGSLGGSLLYDRDLFDAPTMQRLLRSFRNLLADAVARPGGRLGELRLLGAAERHQLTVEWAGWTEGGWPASTVMSRFAAQVEAAPQALALIAGEVRWSFRELDVRANRVAHGLLRRVGGRGSQVGLLAGRSAAMVAGLLGIFKAGAAYTPLDPAYPRARLAWLLEDSQCALVLAERGVPVGLGPHQAEVVTVEELLAEQEAVAASEANPGSRAGPGDLAYLLYTSGTTGAPKAVMVDHGSLANTLEAAQRQFQFGPGDRMPVIAPFSFDIFLFELLAPLLAGGTAQLLPLDPTLDLGQLAAALREATRFHAVPAVARQAVEMLRDAGLGAGSGLRDIFVGGDAVPAGLLADLRRLFPAARIRILYGPTEGAIFCATYTVADGAATPPSLLGRPVGGATLQLFDRRGQPVPLGVPGELCIGGRAVSRGYLNRPELTAERFVAAEGQRLYRTGDLARHLPDGNLEFLGRVDRQVKIRGMRIELGEVEAVLAQHPRVREAVAMAREDGSGDRRLVAWVVPAPPDEAGDGATAGPRPDELLSFLADRLPRHMVPSAFVMLDSLPLGANGKVDRSALPPPGPPAAPAAPATSPEPVEELIAAVFGQLLGIAAPGSGGHFFELGGHSLKATQLASRLRSIFGVELPLRTVFEGPTVAALAKSVEAALRGGGERPDPPLRRLPRGGELPLSFAQRRMWFVEQLEPGNAAYRIPLAVRLSGRLSRRALAASLDEIVRRHEVLRTRFVEVAPGAPGQVIAPAQPIQLSLVDLSGLPRAEAEARKLAADQEQLAFDLARGPLLRIILVRCAGEEHVALLAMHHIVSDAWSMGVLLGELATLYAAFLAGRPSPLPELPFQYADVADWHHRRLQGRVLEEHLAYWRRQLAGELGAVELPADRPRPALPSYRGASHRFTVAAEVYAAAMALGHREGTTLFMTLLAAFKALLHRYTGQTDLLVGTVIANRNREEMEKLIGCFINTLVLRTKVSGSLTFRELLHRVRDTALGAYMHQDLPFERLVESLAPGRDPSRFPLFQVRFALDNTPPLSLDLPGLVLRHFMHGQETSKFDLTLNVASAGGELVGSVDYRTELFAAATIETFAGRFVALLGAACAAPETRLSRLEMFTLDEKQRRAASLIGSHRRFKAVRPKVIHPGGAAVAEEPEP